MENRNQDRWSTGVHEGWRKAPEPEAARVLREPRPGARRHALLMAGLGVVGAMAALLFAPQLRVPTEAQSGNRSISRALYPKAPGSPPMVAVTPDQPGTLPETPSEPVQPVEPVVKSEPAPTTVAPEVVIREVPAQRPAETRATSRSTRQATAETRTSPSRRRERSTASTRTRSRDRTASRRDRDRPTQMASVDRDTYRQPGESSGRSYRSEASSEVKESSRRRTTRRSSYTRQRSESTRRIASSTRRTPKAITSTAGWKGSTDPKEQRFLKAWQDFKTKEERDEDERRRFSRRVSEELIADPRE